MSKGVKSSSKRATKIETEWPFIIAANYLRDAIELVFTQTLVEFNGAMERDGNRGDSSERFIGELSKQKICSRTIIRQVLSCLRSIIDQTASIRQPVQTGSKCRQLLARPTSSDVNELLVHSVCWKVFKSIGEQWRALEGNGEQWRAMKIIEGQ